MDYLAARGYPLHVPDERNPNGRCPCQPDNYIGGDRGFAGYYLTPGKPVLCAQTSDYTLLRRSRRQNVDGKNGKKRKKVKKVREIANSEREMTVTVGRRPVPPFQSDTAFVAAMRCEDYLLFQ